VQKHRSRPCTQSSRISGIPKTQPRTSWHEHCGTTIAT
jgi:hypothetical protein